MLLSCLIPKFIERIDSLRDAIQKNPQYRFFGSSLLLIFDGDKCARKEEMIIDVRMIDFAHTCTVSQLLSDQDEENNILGPDEGYLFGLKNLLTILSEILHEN